MPLPCPQWWRDSTERVRESSPGASPPRLFALFPLAAGGTRRSRRRLPWPFAWPRSTAAVGAPGPSGSGGVGALFGQPLADLCSQDGMLPQPVQDLLALLNEHGPSTEGIFRLSASERASREIREALDSGVPVQLENHPVLLLAVLLKDLLRKFPSKLLNIQLYEEWMRAMEKTSRQEKLAALKE
ncbi:T-cell activation Rho GTPase-activating protein-like [Guaruba guarouba]